MNHLILVDETANFADSYAAFTQRYMHPPILSGVSKKGRFLYDHFVVVTDKNPVGKYLGAAYDLLCQKELAKTSSIYTLGDGEAAFKNFQYSDEMIVGDVSSLNTLTGVNKTAFMLVVDCDQPTNAASWKETLEAVVKVAASGKQNIVIVNALIPDFPVIPQNITSLSEREFSYYLERKITDRTPEQDFYVALEAQCRALVGSCYTNINLVRVNNPYGPGCNRIHGFDIHKTIAEAFETGVMEISAEDKAQFFDITYQNDIAGFNSRMMYTGRIGQIYNLRSQVVSAAMIKNTLQDLFADRLGINCHTGAVEPEYRCLNVLKFFQAGWGAKQITPLRTGLYNTALDVTGLKHNNQQNIAIYAGKLPRIKDLEMLMLKDIDDICQKHGIKYFLCGGTMLGAIRYGHSIPWDDDLDIGMLRKDFDKFREVCLKEHKDIFNYSSYWNKTGAHYIVDKLRLNGTYFSTRYSSIHEYPDGLFIDILVYDQTSNNKTIGMIHSRLVGLMSGLIQTRWYGRPRRGRNYRKEQLLLPFLKLIPMDWYHTVYEFLLKLFKNKKNAKYVIDSTGKLQKKGPFLMQGLEDVTYVDYDGDFKVPIPVDTTNYLTFDYGPNYLPEPRLSQRVAPHNFARIDLGEYIFDTHPTQEFREVNVQGELFEKEV